MQMTAIQCISQTPPRKYFILAIRISYHMPCHTHSTQAQPGLTEQHHEIHSDTYLLPSPVASRSISMESRSVSAEGVYHVSTGSLCMRACMLSHQGPLRPHMEVAFSSSVAQGGGDRSSGVSFGDARTHSLYPYTCMQMLV